jgi:hypothetical protein
MKETRRRGDAEIKNCGDVEMEGVEMRRCLRREIRGSFLVVVTPRLRVPASAHFRVVLFAQTLVADQFVECG